MGLNISLSEEIENLLHRDSSKMNIPKARIVRGILNQYYRGNLLYKDVDGKYRNTIPTYMLDCGIKTP